MPDQYPVSSYFPGLWLPNANNFEASRLASFKNLTNCSVFAGQLAKAGLVHTGTGDEAKCYWCPFTHRDWQHGQCPTQVHKSCSPGCPLFTKTVTDTIKPNISIPANNNKKAVADIVQDFLHLQRRNPTLTGVQESGTFRHSDINVHTFLSMGVQLRYGWNNAPFTFPFLPMFFYGITFQTAREESLQTLMYPDFASKPQRAWTFRGFPPKEESLPAKLYDCGFFYTGHEDIVICYFCGLALHKWLRGDDPKIVHARWQPDCPHLHNWMSSAVITAVQNEASAIGNTE